MIKKIFNFIDLNKGLITICLTFSLVNKFPLFSFGSFLSWGLILYGMILKERALLEYFDKEYQNVFVA